MTRLINADDFIEEARNRLDMQDLYLPIHIKELVIDEMPTVDAVPVRHEKWEMKPDPFGFFDEIPVCSGCGCTTKMREKTKYCPNCGAKMVEPQESEDNG